MKNFLKNREALTPVTAAIAVISAMIAVAIIAAVLLGSIASSQILSKELSVASVEFTPGESFSGMIVVHVNNPTSTDATITMIKVNGQSASSWAPASSSTVVSSGSESFYISQTVVSGTQYAIEMYDSEGTLRASYTGMA